MSSTRGLYFVGAAAGALISAGSAWAEPAAAPAAGPQPAVQEVVVTGSLIRRKDYVSESPIVTVNTNTLQQAGGPAGMVDVGLSQLPQFTPTAGSSASFPNRLGQALLNLRGLGSNRMLVLLDGRRVQPSSPDGSVDVSLLPSNLVQSVETITGGASSVYGSDAITGVVNFKLIQNFKGGKLDAQYNEPELGHGGSWDVNLLLGSPFAQGRGSAVLSLDYTDRGEVKAGDRAFYVNSRANGVLPFGIVNFGALPPTQAAVNSVFAGYGFAAGSVSATKPIGVNYDGSLFTPAPSPLSVVNYKGPLGGPYLLVKNAIVNSAGQSYDIEFPMHRANVFGRVTYDLSDDVRLFGTVLYNHSVNDVKISTIGLGLGSNTTGSVPVTYPFIPTDLKTLLASRANPAAPFSVSYLFSSLDPVDFHTVAENLQLVGGADGKLFAGDWTWSIYGTYGRSTTDQRISGFSHAAAQRLLSAPDAGASLCSGGLNVFGPPESISPACRGYLSALGSISSSFEQDLVDGSVQGPLFKLPAGELKVAVGADYRRNSFESTPDPIFLTGDLVPQGVILPALGSQDVKEFYVEALAPIVHDLPLVQQFNIDAGYRYSDYSTSGGVSTYKVDFDLLSVGGLRFRGGYARAIRAPSLADLYSPALVTSVALGTPSSTNVNGDPCDIRSSYRHGANAAQVRALCLAQGVPASIIDTFTFTNNNVFPTTVGNANLNPETADTYTAGVVWRSPLSQPLFRTLQASIDYYDIRVKNAVGTIPFLTELSSCFNGDKVSNPSYANTNVFCSVIKRDSLGDISGDSRSTTLNLAAYKTDGIDFQLDWQVRLGDLGLDDRFGSINLNFVGNWLDKFVVQNFSTARALDYSGSTQGAITLSVLPKWKAVTTLTYMVGPASVGLRWRYLAPVHDVSRVTTVNSTTAGVPAYNYFDLNTRWRLHLHRDLELRFGINNLFDKGIPQVGAVPGTTDPTTYDILGRTYYFGMTARF